MPGSTPGFLVAMPHLKDPNFADTVVLMLEHNAEGAVGLVVNRPFPGDPGTIATGLGIDWPRRTLGQVRYGGPVRTQNGCLLHPPSNLFPDSQIVGSGIAVSTSRDALTGVLESPSCPFRLMLGYAGWGPGQLERELREGSWLFVPVSSALLFDTPADKIYDMALASIGAQRFTLGSGGSNIH